MTIDRDDPEARSRDARRESEARRAADDALFESVSAIARGLLQRAGFPSRAVDAILNDAFEDLRIFGRSVTDRRAFLAKRVRARAQQYRQLRGIEAVEEQPPHLLDLLRMDEALATLPDNLRTVLKILYHEKGTFADVAKALNVSVFHAERLARKALDELSKWRPRRGPWV